MDKGINLMLDEFAVNKLEEFASLLESIEYSKEGTETKFLIFILNIESLLPKSSIFDYVYKKDTYKSELEFIDQEMWKLKNRLSDIHNEIDDSEWEIEQGSNEEIIFNSIKEKLVTQKGLNYGNI